MKNIILFIKLVTFAFIAPVFASQPDDDARPKIGLVLSGGGARGAAHVGVLKVLEEHKIPIDMIAGTSFGAIVGGLYAAGYDAAELEQILANINWQETLSSDAPRNKRTFRRKKDDDGFQIKFKLSLEEGEIKLPSGLITPNNLRLMLGGMVNSIGNIDHFDNLPIPFRAVATDLETGDAVILDRGNLSSAMVASMTVPALFPPMELDGRLLVDGGSANNIPINVARQMGADILIVVDISEPLKTREQIKSFTDVIDQLSMLQSNKLAQTQIASLTDNDIFLKPDLAEIGFVDFDNAIDAVPKGADAARAYVDQIKKYALDNMAWRQHLDGRTDRNSQSLVINQIEIHNNSNISDKVIEKELTTEEGKPLDSDALTRNLTAIYGSELFEDVNYSIDSTGERNILRITTRERENGEDYIRFGLALQESFEGQNGFQVSASYTNLAINELGGEWKTLFKMGEELSLFTEFYQPVDYGQRYYLFANSGGRRINRNLNDDQDSRFILEQRRISDAHVELGAGRNFGNWGTLRASLRRSFANMRDRNSFPADILSTFDRTTIGAEFIIDTLDNMRFPRSGSALNITYENNLTFLGGDDVNDRVEMRGFHPLSWDDNTIGVRYQFSTGFNGSARPIDLFQLGSFMQLSAYAPGQITGYHGGSIAGIYYRKISGGVQPLGNTPIYVGGTIEAGNAWNIRDHMALDDLRWSTSLFVGADTLIGPVYLGAGLGEEGQASAFLYVGQIF